MFNWIKEYCRKKYIKNFSRRKDIAFFNLKNITSVGFLYNISSKESVAELLEIYYFLKKKGIKFRGLAVEGEKNVFERVVEEKGKKPVVKIPDQLIGKQELDIVTYEKISWTGVADDAMAKEFFKEKSDLFISFNKDENFTLNHLFATYVDSPMRVGMVNDSPVSYTIVMEGKDKTILPVQVYLNQIFYYLEIIKTE